MGRRPSGKTKSQLALEYQGRLSDHGLVRTTAWVPPEGREAIQHLAKRLRQEAEVLLPYEAKRQKGSRLSAPKPRLEKPAPAQVTAETPLPLRTTPGKLPGLP